MKKNILEIGIFRSSFLNVKEKGFPLDKLSDSSPLTSFYVK